MARAPAAAAGGGNGGCPAVRQSDCLVGEFFTPEASYRYSGLCPANASVASADACRRLGRLLGGNPDAVMSTVTYYHRATGCYVVRETDVLYKGHPTINWNTAVTDIPATFDRRLVCTVPGCTPCPFMMTTDGSGQDACSVECQGDVGGGCDYRQMFGHKYFWGQVGLGLLLFTPFFVCCIFCPLLVSPRAHFAVFKAPWLANYLP